MNHGHRPRKRFGQHFLADPQVIHDIVREIGASAGETLVEIGPGRGAITMPLLDCGATLHGVELDRDLAATLEHRLANSSRFILHQADALKFDLQTIGSDLRVVGNLPYNISTPLIFHLLDSLDAIRDMHFMLQKEVVERMAAQPGSRRYGRLTVMLGCRATVEKLFDVSPEAFSPPPEVWSSVLRILPRREDPFEITDPGLLDAIVRQAFSQRRKILRNALGNTVGSDLLDAAGIDPSARAETVAVENWVELANRVADAR